MRRMGTARHVVDEERLLGRRRVQSVHVVDGVIRHVGDEVVAGLADPWKNLARVAEKVRRPLVGLAAHEAVEIFESHSDRPLVERPGRAVQIGWGVMVLAEPRGGKSVIPQNGPDRRTFLANDGIVARIAGGHFTDHAKPDRVVVAAGDQRCPRRRAERCRVKLRVTQARLGDAIHVRGRDHAAEGAGHAITLVVGHDQQHVRRAFGRHNGRWPVWLGVRGIFLDHAFELRRFRRKLLAIDGCRGARRTRRAGGLLRDAGRLQGAQQKSDGQCGAAKQQVAVV
ncbi:hypothetical protein AB7M73_009350 [Bradyrhizobium japonicum]